MDFNLSKEQELLRDGLGKALGGASGGYIAARRLAVDLLRQRSRPYLFSNSLAPFMPAPLGLATRLRNEKRRLWFAHVGL